MSSDYRTVSLPPKLYERIREHLVKTSFKSVDDFVVFVVNIALGKEAPVLEVSDEDVVVERLRALGYA